jgi:hypothetical protein
VGAVGAGSGASASASSVIVPSHAETQEIPAALVSADGRQIITTGRGGGAVASISLTATESRTTVTLSLTVVRAKCPCTADLRLLPERVTLAAPLGDRKLIDHATGGEIVSMSGRELARVGWLPAGFATTAVDTLAPSDDRGPVGWVRTFAEVAHPENHIDVVQWRSTSVPYMPPPNSARTVQVNDAAGRAWNDGGADQGYATAVVGRHVEWQQAEYTFVASDVLDTVPSGASVLSEADLLRVARSLALP